VKLWLALRVGVSTAVMLVRFLRDYRPHRGQVLQVGTLVTFEGDHNYNAGVSVAMKFKE